MAGSRITWLEAPANPKREDLRTILDLAAGEEFVATAIPLKPDGALVVLHIAAVFPDEFESGVVTAFQKIADELLAQLTADEQKLVEAKIAERGEIGSATGADEEEMSVVVPRRLAEDAKRKISALFPTP